MSTRAKALIATALPLGLVVLLLMFITQVEQDRQACTPDGTVLAAAAVDPASVPQGPIAGYSGQQLINAATIMEVAKARGLSARDQQIGIMAAMGESSLVNVSHGDAVRADTIGLFQIGPEHGARADRLDPAWAAGNFFDRLTAIGGYTDLEPTIAAHQAQRNADPYHYERFWAPAGQVLAALGGVETTTPTVQPAAAGPLSGQAATDRYSLGPVQPQLANLVGVLAPRFGIETVGGYRASATDPGGHPAGLAADFMVPLTAAGKTQGDALAAYAMQNATELRVDYIIWQQRIWSAGRAAEGWRPMEDRGSATANHLDHPHINVLPDGGTTTSGGSSTTQAALDACAETGASGAWVAPVDVEVSSGYGPRIHPIRGGTSLHDGADYAASCGTSIKAASGGTVIEAGPDPIYGSKISIDHGGGIVTRYGHMYPSGVLVRVGDQVQTGDVIARIGSAGWSTGCHLHFIVEVDGETVDPVKFLADPPTTGGIGGDGLVMVQANVKHFATDAALVRRLGPDFITFNEANNLAGQLGRDGYAAAGPTGPPGPGRSTAVAWRRDRWSLVDAGRTVLVANGPQRFDRNRSATWAILAGADGARVSVVSVHHMVNPAKFGPNKPARQRLYADGMRRLQQLVSTLASAGPVFVGGDFNSQYGANDPWGPRRMLGAIGMRSTFDVRGPTATHQGGGVIDYLFFQPSAAFPTVQQTRPLRSDHHAVIARFTTPN